MPSNAKNSATQGYYIIVILFILGMLILPDRLVKTFGVGLFLVTGIFLIQRGFQDLKLKRTLQDIPTSKIKTGAVGTNVEIKGWIDVERDQLATGPISSKQCAFYKLSIEKLIEDSDGDERWSPIDSFFSDDGFILDDESGANAMIQVEGATIKFAGEADVYEVDSKNKTSPKSLEPALRKYKKNLKFFELENPIWSYKKYRFLEERFMPDENIYVLGYADSGIKVKTKKKPKMKYFLQAKKIIQKDKNLQKRFDTNQDGKLDFNELERGARIVAQKLAEEYGQGKAEKLVPKIKMFFKKEKAHPFVISNDEESDLTTHIGKNATIQIWVGFILTFSCTMLFFFGNFT